MADIDFENNILRRDYYKLTHATELIKKRYKDFMLDDLLHLASRSVIPISWHIPTLAPVNAYIECDESIYFKDYLDDLASGDFIDEISLDDFTFLNNVYRVENKEVNRYGYNITTKDEDFDGLLNAEISGVWDLSSWGAELFELYKNSDAGLISWVYPTSMIDDYNFIALTAHEKRVIKLDELVITEKNISAILGDDIDENYFSKKLNTASNKKPHMTEYHSRKRESVLSAALYMKINKPEKCNTYFKWAESINDHAHLFWDDGNMPLSVETVCELIGKSISKNKKNQS